MKQRIIYREPKVKGRKLGLKSMILTKGKKIEIQLEQNEETRIQKKKMRRGLGTSGTT